MSFYQTSNHQQTTSVQEPVEETASPDSNSETLARTPPSKNSALSTSAPTTPAASHATPAPVNVPSHNLSSASIASPVLQASGSTRPDGGGASSPVSLPNSAKDEELSSFLGHRSSPSHSDAGLVRGVGRGGISNQSSSVPIGSSNILPGNSALGAVSSTSDLAKRNILVADDRLGSGGMVQPLVSPSSNRMILPQATKVNDGNSSTDAGNVGENASIPGRVFSPSLVSGMQWRPGSSFQSPNEPVFYIQYKTWTMLLDRSLFHKFVNIYLSLSLCFF